MAERRNSYSESGLTVTLPTDSGFRFAELSGYLNLSGKHLKEMDFGWAANGHLWLLELRGYSQLPEEANLTAGDFVLPHASRGDDESRRSQWRFVTLVEKVTDSLLMLGAVWGGTPAGRELAAGMPEAVRRPLPVKVLVGLDLPPGLAVHLGAIRDSLLKFRSSFRPGIVFANQSHP